MKTRRIESNRPVNLSSIATHPMLLAIGGLVHAVRTRFRFRSESDKPNTPAGAMIAVHLAGTRFVPLLLTAMLLSTAVDVSAGVVFTSLHSFGIHTNGENPYAPPVQGRDGNFYGTTYGGGTNGGYGTVFKITTNGVLTVLHAFAGRSRNDGANPHAGLVLGDDGYFYGTTSSGGTGNYGTVFKISTNGVFTNLYSFNYNTGYSPYGRLVQGSDGNFYGTTYRGGTNGGYGTVFKITTNGVLTSLYSFPGGNDGAYPYAGLVQGSDGDFYGTTYSGGTNGFGTVFKITTNGVFTSLYSFTGGNNGSYPYAGLVQGSDGNFYGTTSSGGSNYSGTVFKIAPGGEFTSLVSFNSSDGSLPYYGALVQGGDGYFYGTTYRGGTNNNNGEVFKVSTNGVLIGLYSFTDGNDGKYPYGGLASGSGGNLYGTTYQGGMGSGGTVFKITTNGVFSSLYSFTGADDGANPGSKLVQGTDGDLYGTTPNGGTNVGSATGSGTVFKITTDGVLKSLHTFYGDINRDGGTTPYGGLVQGNDGYFYGTTEGGTTNYRGAVFRISASGALTPLFSFTGGRGDGAYPYGGVVQGSDGNLYGTTSGTTYYDSMNPNGLYTNGIVFKISPAGVFTRLYYFTGGNDGRSPNYGKLVQGSNGDFYGTTSSGGTYTNGTVFKVSPDGVFTSLYSFTGGNDGRYPESGLALGNDGNLYGTTSGGGSNYSGTVFKISPAGVYTSLYSFRYSDGSSPYCALVLGSDGSFYGTTENGGTNGSYGTVFRITTNGVLTSLYSFTGGSDGAYPQAGLVQGYDGKFYGTTTSGGIGGQGTVFSISVGITGNPIVHFTASSTGGMPPLTVQFKSPNADIVGNPIVSWNWDFGDGETSTNQYPLHTYKTVGTFSPTLVATNNQGVKVTGLGPQITISPVNLVQNGGFEKAGDFSNWTTKGDFKFCSVTTDKDYVHSGYYGAELGPIGSPSFISQTLTTIPGQSYLISLWLNSPDGSTPNGFLVNWDGNTLFDQTNILDIGWTNLQFTVTATGTSSVLRFGFRDDFSYLGLDDISVLPVSNAAAAPIIQTTDGSFGLRTNRFGFNISGVNNLIVVIEASTNLVNPVWTPVSTNTLTGGIHYFYDPKWTNYPQRFYRISSP